jgi:predicted nuclease of predicted toxin-antitoxin system
LAQRAGCPDAVLTDKLLIDECLSGSLAAAAKERGLLAHYVPHIGKAGWQDYNLVPFAIENDYIVVRTTADTFSESTPNLVFTTGSS